MWQRKEKERQPQKKFTCGASLSLPLGFTGSEKFYLVLFLRVLVVFERSENTCIKTSTRVSAKINIFKFLLVY